MKTLRNFGPDQQGQDLVEYALVVLLIGVGAASIMPSIARSIEDLVAGSSGNVIRLLLGVITVVILVAIIRRRKKSNAE